MIGKPYRVSDDHKYKNEFDETNAEIVRINNKVLEVNEEMLNNHAKNKKKIILIFFYFNCYSVFFCFISFLYLQLLFFSEIWN